MTNQSEINKFLDADGELTHLGEKLYDILIEFKDPSSMEAINKAIKATGLTPQEIKTFLNDGWKENIIHGRERWLKEIATFYIQNISSRIPSASLLSDLPPYISNELKNREEEIKKQKQESLKKQIKKQMKEIEKSENKEEMIASLQTMMDQLKSA